MNQHLRREAPAPAPSASTPTDARKLAVDLMEIMSALLGVIERETELVRAGKVREGMRLEQQKTELTGRYVTAVETMRMAQKHLSQVAPELLAALKRHHETFRAMLQINLTVLATAHAVSEGIVRGVNAEVQRHNMPNAYTAGGQRAARHLFAALVYRPQFGRASRQRLAVGGEDAFRLPVARRSAGSGRQLDQIELSRPADAGRIVLDCQ